MTDEQDDGLDGAATAILINQIFDLWVNPELTSRGLELTRTAVDKVIVELEPGKAPKVLLNDEGQLVAEVVATRAIAAGEAVTLADIESLKNLRPLTVGPDSGWLCFARIGGQDVVAFDFTYNRARAAVLVSRAREFLEAARLSASAAVAVDNAHSAAELAVQAQMLVIQLETRRHQERREWFSSWAQHQNAPQEHADVLWNLTQLRPAARYGEGELRLKPGRLERILAMVEGMIDLAAARLRGRSDT